MATYTKSESMLKDVCKLLHEEALGFNGILALLRKERKDQGKKLASSETLSEALKRLQESGYVRRDIRTRKYSLTDLGEMSVRDPFIAFRVKPRRDSKGNPMDIIKFLIDAHVHALETGGEKKNKLPDSVVQQITDQVKQFANGKTAAIEKLWTDITSNFEGEVSSFLPAFMLMHTSYASPEYIPVTIDKAVSLWARFRLDQLQHTLSNYLSHPQVLAAIDRAIKEDAFTANLFSTPFEEVCRTLKRQKYL